MGVILQANLGVDSRLSYQKGPGKLQLCLVGWSSVKGFTAQQMELGSGFSLPLHPELGPWEGCCEKGSQRTQKARCWAAGGLQSSLSGLGLVC